MLMRMISSVIGGGLLLAGGAQAAEPEKVWQAEGLDGPESAVLDSGEGVDWSTAEALAFGVACLFGARAVDDRVGEAHDYRVPHPHDFARPWLDTGNGEGL